MHIVNDEIGSYAGSGERDAIDAGDMESRVECGEADVRADFVLSGNEGSNGRVLAGCRASRSPDMS